MNDLFDHPELLTELGVIAPSSDHQTNEWPDDWPNEADWNFILCESEPDWT